MIFLSRNSSIFRWLFEVFTRRNSLVRTSEIACEDWRFIHWNENLFHPSSDERFKNVFVLSWTKLFQFRVDPVYRKDERKKRNSIQDDDERNYTHIFSLTELIILIKGPLKWKLPIASCQTGFIFILLCVKLSVVLNV